MASNAHKLLEYIAMNKIVPIKVREAQLDASAVEDVSGETEVNTREVASEVERLAPYFERGLAVAQQSGGKVTVDDIDEEGNGIAEAFARFLVVPGLATSQSTDLPDGHYRYEFVADLAGIKELSDQLGLRD